MSPGAPAGAAASVDSRADDYAGALPSSVALPPATLRALSRLDPLRTWAHIAGEWIAIAAAVALCERFFHPALYVVAVLWIGARQHALGILMHDGAHRRLFKSRLLNDVVSEALLAWPIFLTTAAYRRTHFAHHRHVNTDDDPDFVRKRTDAWRFPKSRRDLARLLLKDALGLSLPQWVLMVLALSGLVPAAERRETLRARGPLVARIAYYGAALAAIAGLGVSREVLLYWLVPQWTWFMVIMHVRSIAEHFAVENDDVLTITRTTYPSLLERLFVCPKNVNYHLDHHLYPSVPFYRLPDLHARLLESEAFRERAHVTRTYLGVLRECTGARRAAGGRSEASTRT